MLSPSSRSGRTTASAEQDAAPKKQTRHVGGDINDAANFTCQQVFSFEGDSHVQEDFPRGLSRVNNSVILSGYQGPVIGRLMLAAGDESGNESGRLVNGSLTYASGPLSLTASLVRSAPTRRKERAWTWVGGVSRAGTRVATTETVVSE